MIQRIFLAPLVLCISLVAVETIHAQLINFELEGQAGTGLLPGNEVGTSNSTGSGGTITEIVLNLGTRELFIDVGWGSGNGFTDLTGDATAMHIHGPATFTENAGVQYGLNGLAGFDASATSGGLNDSLIIDAVDIQDLRDGLFYINVHTADNGAGELRANLVESVPEPGSLGLLGLCSAWFLRRKRS